MKATCLIVDDEPLAVQLLKKHVTELNGLELVGTCENAIEASSFLMLQPVELLFLDIQMPRLTGIDLLRALKAPPSVIITTAHREYAIQGYDFDIIDYLLKPITFERFLASVERFWYRRQKNTSVPHVDSKKFNDIFLSIKSGSKIYQFNESEIVYIESLKDFIQIYFKDGKKTLIKYRISQMEVELSDSFIRVHKSYIVNRKSITKFSSNIIEMRQITVPVGESYKPLVENFFKK